MKCQKCARPSVVHLTEILTHTDANGTVKRAMEIHLCLSHAVEAGLLTPASKPAPVPSKAAAVPQEKTPAPQSGSIVPAKRKASPLALPAKPAPVATEHPPCPICGIAWSEFKKNGVMGCPHDYEQFVGSLMPLLKRAHEGATEHHGKVPQNRRQEEVEKSRTLARLRKDLEKAIALEHYEAAARLRDQLRELGHA
jgi:protein arginine kinase activator